MAASSLTITSAIIFRRQRGRTEFSTSYGVPNGATFIEVDGRLVMYGPLGGLSNEGNITNIATLLTSISTGTAGLREADTFAAGARFDFINPDDARQLYGVRLTDAVNAARAVPIRWKWPFVKLQPASSRFNSVISTPATVPAGTVLLGEVVLSDAQSRLLKATRSRFAWCMVRPVHRTLPPSTRRPPVGRNGQLARSPWGRANLQWRGLDAGTACGLGAA